MTDCAINQQHVSLLPARASGDDSEIGPLMALGGALLARGDDAGARAVIDQALAQAAGSPMAAETLALRCLHVVGAGPARADSATMAALLARVAEACALQLGETNPAMTALRCRLGDAWHAEGDFARARQQYDIVLTAHRASATGDNDAIAWALSGMGDVLRAERRYPAALMYLQRALRRQSEIHGAHPATARTHTRLGALWFDQGQYAEARTHFQESLTMREATLGPRDPATAQSLHNLGLTLAALGDLRSARVCLAQALAIREDRLGREHLATAQSLDILSQVLAGLGDHESAQYCLERAAALYRERLGEQHPASSAAAGRLQERRRGGARWMRMFRRNA